MNDTINALQQRYDFLCDAWVRGMCDAIEVENAHRQLESALAETFKETPNG
jgi:hypothetical protein